MEQSFEQSRTQSPEETKRPVPANFVGKNWQPGQSGNPRGRALRADQEKAEVKKLTDDYIERHGCAPNRAMQGYILNGAKISVRIERGHLRPRVLSYLILQFDRVMRKLGLDKPPPRGGASDAAFPSSSDFLKGAGK
jgi:hypothetical protein